MKIGVQKIERIAFFLLNFFVYVHIPCLQAQVKIQCYMPVIVQVARGHCFIVTLPFEDTAQYSGSHKQVYTKKT